MSRAVLSERIAVEIERYMRKRYFESFSLPISLLYIEIYNTGGKCREFVFFSRVIVRM